jgi:hypothetical protein
VTGAARVGQTLTCSPAGAFTGDGLSYAYAWLRGATAIAGQTASTYAVTASDEGATLTCAVTARAVTGGPVSAASGATASIPTPVGIPTGVGIKRVSGTVGLVSATLSVSKGRAAVKLRCTGGELGCTGKLKLEVIETGRALTARASTHKAKSKTVVLATGAYRIASGRSATLTLKIAATGTKLLGAHHNKIPVGLLLTPSGGKTVSHKVTLKAVVVRTKKRKANEK